MGEQPGGVCAGEHPGKPPPTCSPCLEPPDQGDHIQTQHLPDFPPLLTPLITAQQPLRNMDFVKIVEKALLTSVLGDTAGRSRAVLPHGTRVWAPSGMLKAKETSDFNNIFNNI